VGRKGLQFLVRGKFSILADFEIKDNFSYFSAESVAKFCMDQFLSGNVNRVSVLYTNFVNTLTQRVEREQLVPVRSFEIGRVALDDGDGSSDTAAVADIPEYILEPNRSDFLGSLLPHFIFFKVFNLLLEARASEHSARMVAMKSATDNAKQLIKDLTLEYNKVRQASITTEILEIATAQMVLS
jgi:F-type H+-transporting ATPase subunit gamma